MAAISFALGGRQTGSWPIGANWECEFCKLPAGGQTDGADDGA